MMPGPGRLEWLQRRSRGVGASEVAALFAEGEHRYHSPLSLYHLKRGNAPEDVDNESAEWGQRLEAVAADWYAEMTGRQLTDHGRFHVVPHPTAPLLCTLDREQRDETRGVGCVEFKAPSEWVLKQWEKGGVPLWGQIQLQAQLACTGWTWGTICAQFPHRRPLWWDVARNDAFIDVLVRRVTAFWNDHVLTGIPPAVDGHSATERVLKFLHPDDNGETVTLPPEAIEWDVQLEAAREEEKAAKKKAQAIENKIRAAIGDATFGDTLDGVRYSLKTTERKGFSVDATTYRALRRSDKEIR
jgi:putative phage-type endonuclease